MFKIRTTKPQRQAADLRERKRWKLYMLLILLPLLSSCLSESSSDTSGGSETQEAAGTTTTPIRSLPLSNTQTSVLILHDSGGDWGYIGKEHAMLLENLLGHFEVSVRTQPVTTYNAGQVNNYSATFYLGTTYDEPSFYPESSSEQKNYDQFLSDVISTSSTVVWINHNLWKLAWHWPDNSGLESFSNQFGFKYNGLVNLKYNRVMYKGKEFKKGVVRFAHPGAVLEGCEEEKDGQYACSPELNKVKIEDSIQVITHASAYSTEEPVAGYTPYIIQSNNFWFVGDLPFLHHSIEDRYLVFADALFDMLGKDASSEAKHALLRLDNIHPKTDYEHLQKSLNYLEDENIPHSAAVSPLFINNENAGEQTSLAETAIADLLRYHHESDLLSVASHGLSHQWEGGDNPHSGKTGDDFEFYRVSKNDDLSLTYEGPLESDNPSAERTQQRLQQSEALLYKAGLHAFAWTAPHYMASESDYLIAQERFPVHYGRLHYFSPNGPEGRFVEQMFPYQIKHDRYDYRVIPENLGGIETSPETGYEFVDPEDILERVDRLSVIRDHVASVYFDVTQPLHLLKELVSGLQDRGYTFIAPCTLGYSCRDTVPDKDLLYIKSRQIDGRVDSGSRYPANSSEVKLASPSESISQAWNVTTHSNNYVHLSSAKSLQCITAHTLNESGLPVSQGVCDSSNERQLWKQYGTDLRNKANGQCLDVASDQETIITSACDNATTQQWQLNWETKD